ncbi:MAG: cadherin-like beta sandwich domain-containing protein [Chromatiales bacterium]|nr:cadherin-like beta sandwich domain-containing protein [Chromatiales bacterium]
MATYNTNDFKNGLKILLNGKPHTIIENECIEYDKGVSVGMQRLLMRIASDRLAFFSIVLLLILMLCQPAVAQQTSLPSCTQDIADTDGDGVPAAMDIDKDGDGLIELCSLEGLNAVRYQPDGKGYRPSIAPTPLITAGCPQDGCRGYELVRSLDFEDANSYDSGNINTAWTAGEGWLPIGIISADFNAVFEGNGHTISNLMIDRSSDDTIGLFEETDSNSKIRNIGLLNNVVAGNNFVGSLVGFNQGSIANSYATGEVIGTGNGVGGLVSDNRGTITNSYATGVVTGNTTIGGLVGDNNSGTITNSYATGNVNAQRRAAGGLVGLNRSSITNTYATGDVRGEQNFELGKLVGNNVRTITNSYATRDNNNAITLVGSIGTRVNSMLQTIAELQSPIMPTGIYSQWSTANWDFGTKTQYPALKYTSGSDDNDPACGAAGQPSCDSLLPNQFPDQFPTLLDTLTVTNRELEPEFNPQTFSYNVMLSGQAVDSITLQATAQPTATMDSVITISGNSIQERTVTSTISQDVRINEDGDTTIMIEVSGPNGRSAGTYVLTVVPPSSDASLSGLMLTQTDRTTMIPLTEDFSPTTTTYTAEVANRIAQVRVIPTATHPEATIRVDSIEVANERASNPIRLAAGEVTIITIVVTAQDTTINTYTIAVSRAANSDATLANLAVSEGQLTPLFRSNEVIYSVSVVNAIQTITVTPTANNVNATITVDDEIVVSGSASRAISLTEGEVTTVTITVTAQDSTINTYTIAVSRAVSSDATLANLAVSEGELSEPFMSTARTYTVLVENDVASLTVTPTANNANATITVDDETVVSDSASRAISLTEGEVTTVTITVTAQDGTINTYTITVTRAPSRDASLSNLVLTQMDGITIIPLTEGFSPTTTTYTAEVANRIERVRVRPTKRHPNATIQVASETVASGRSSGDIDLIENGVTMITVVVTAQDGDTMEIYTVAVTRAASSDASLSNLVLTQVDGITIIPLTETFAPTTTTYTAEVANMVAQVRVMPTATHPDATITVDSNTVVNDDGEIDLTEGGMTVITIAVTAQDGRTNRTYAIAVTRLGSSDASLSDLQLIDDNQTVINIFQESTTTYTVSVPNMVTQVRVMPTATEDALAMIAVSAVNFITETVASGSATDGFVSLGDIGEETMIDIVVTAPDKVTQITYRVFLIRAELDASSDASLRNLVLRQTDNTLIRLVEDFAPTTMTYTAEVANMVAQVQVIPTANHPNAAIRVNDVLVLEDGSRNIILTEGGFTPIKIEVTAEDRITSETYTVTVRRDPSTDASLGNLQLIQTDGTTMIPLTEDFAPTTTTYKVEVENMVEQVRVMPTAKHPDATITVDSNTVVNDDGEIDLTEGGVTTITIVVTAQDKQTTETYTVAVTRAPSRDASLSNLVLKQMDGTTIIPRTETSAPTTTTYTAEVANRVAQVQVIPTANNPNATITVNGIGLASGRASQFIDLNDEGTTIMVVVTAQDGNTMETHTITVSRVSDLRVRVKVFLEGPLR